MKKTLIATVVLALLGGASLYAWKHHPSTSDAGHDHGPRVEAAGHGHDHGEEGLQVTHYAERTELFVEFPRLVVGEEAAFAAHLTQLADFKPVLQGRVSVALLGSDGKPVDTAGVDQPTVPGIFRPVIKPGQTGQHRLVLRLEAGDLGSVHDLGAVTVYPDKAAAAQAAAGEPHEDHGGIAFTKEQQWQTDFATTPVVQRSEERRVGKECRL